MQVRTQEDHSDYLAATWDLSQYFEYFTFLDIWKFQFKLREGLILFPV